MERVETLKRGEKQIIYFDLSGIQTNRELIGVVEEAKEAIKAFEADSVYTITNIGHIVFDTQTKEIAADWMAFNKPYVVSAAFIGASGIRKIMMNMVFTLSKRTNVKLFNDMNQALAWIEEL